MSYQIFKWFLLINCPWLICFIQTFVHKSKIRSALILLKIGCAASSMVLSIENLIGKVKWSNQKVLFLKRGRWDPIISVYLGQLKGVVWVKPMHEFGQLEIKRFETIGRMTSGVAGIACPTLSYEPLKSLPDMDYRMNCLIAMDIQHAIADFWCGNTHLSKTIFTTTIF